MGAHHDTHHRRAESAPPLGGRAGSNGPALSWSQNSPIPSCADYEWRQSRATFGLTTDVHNQSLEAGIAYARAVTKMLASAITRGMAVEVARAADGFLALALAPRSG